MKYIAFIHAKESSIRVPNKNVRILGDKPLVAHAVCTAVESDRFDEIVIDSDSDKIISIGLKYGATKALKRNKSQATNDFTGDDLAYWQASNFPYSDICVQIVPTSPFLTSKSVLKALDILIGEDAVFESVIGIRSERQYVFDWKPKKGRIVNSFELPVTVTETTGLYANRTKNILRDIRRTSYPVFGLTLPKIECIDINTPEDFEFAEIVWRGMQ